MPTLKGTEVSLSYVQCFLYLASSSINISIFHSAWLDTFSTDLVFLYCPDTVAKQPHLASVSLVLHRVAPLLSHIDLIWLYSFPPLMFFLLELFSRTGTGKFSSKGTGGKYY